MNAKRVLLVGAGLLGISALMPPARGAEDPAQNGKPVMITRFFTGPDGLTHAEEIEVKFAPGGGAYNLLANSGAQIRRTPPGRELDYHTAGRRADGAAPALGHTSPVLGPKRKDRWLRRLGDKLQTVVP